MGDRSRGVLLYALSGALLAIGGAWFVHAAPESGDDPRVATWRENAGQMLPDLPYQVASGTMIIMGASSTERTVGVSGGSYALSMVCVGDGGQVRVRLSESGDDSGRAVPCAEQPSSITLTVALAGDYFMSISGETDGTAVFRWRLDRVRGF